jgi:membrane protein implicated in regulation of membrane protease activity
LSFCDPGPGVGLAWVPVTCSQQILRLEDPAKIFPTGHVSISRQVSYKEYTMMQEFFTFSALNLLYAAAVFVSFVFAMLVLFGAGIGDAFDFDLDAGVDAAAETDFDFLSISPFALAMFGAAFGLTGLITRLAFDMGAAGSLFWATVFGLIVGAMAQALFLYVLSPSKSSHYSLADVAVGRDAEVIITIPAEGLGTIALDTKSGRVTLGARSAAGKEIAKGQPVSIEKVTGRVAVVRLAGEHEWSQLKQPSDLKMK